jgi:hypothetical protein
MKKWKTHKKSTRCSGQILIKPESSLQIFEKYSNAMQIRAMGAELFQADGQTEMTNLIVAFCNSANAPKKYFRTELTLTRRLWMNQNKLNNTQ